MKFKLIYSLAITGILSAVSATAVSKGKDVPYPEGYRNWRHIKSMLIQPGHTLTDPFQGIHHIYANKKALKGLQTGKYADGSVLVFDLLNYVEKDKAITEGERKLVGVMYKAANKYAATGGWGFEGFGGNSKTERLVEDGGTDCFSCHASEKANDYVFSKLRD